MIYNKIIISNILRYSSIEYRRKHKQQTVRKFVCNEYRKLEDNLLSALDDKDVEDRVLIKYALLECNKVKQSRITNALTIDEFCGLARSVICDIKDIALDYEAGDFND